jgi:hypothetical protein
MANGTSIFWLKGVTGCGKTVIAQMQNVPMQMVDLAQVSFGELDDRCNLHLIFPTLAYQLAYHHPTKFRPTLMQIICSNPDIKHNRLEV